MSKCPKLRTLPAVFHEESSRAGEQTQTCSTPTDLPKTFPFLPAPEEWNRAPGTAGLPGASALKALTVTTFNSASAPLAAWRNNKMFCWAHGSSLCPPAMAGGTASWPTAKYYTRTSLNWVYLSFSTEIILAEVFPHSYHYYFILTNSTLRSN